MRGTAANPVRNLAFKGITFSGATWLDPSYGAGYVPDQAGVLVDAGKNPVTGEHLNKPTTDGHSQFTKATPGNVAVSFARNLGFRGNVFGNLGGVGLQLGTGVQSTRVVGNVITNFVTQVYDGGAIYTTGAQGRGWADATLIRGNQMHGKRPLGGSNIIYTDGGTRWVIAEDNLQYDNRQGVFWMGADFSLSDGLNFNLSSGPYSFFPLLQNGQPYGSEIGGCITAGNIRYRDKVWEIAGRVGRSRSRSSGRAPTRTCRTGQPTRCSTTRRCSPTTD